MWLAVMGASLNTQTWDSRWHRLTKTAQMYSTYQPHIPACIKRSNAVSWDPQEPSPPTRKPLTSTWGCFDSTFSSNNAEFAPCAETKPAAELIVPCRQL